MGEVEVVGYLYFYLNGHAAIGEGSEGMAFGKAQPESLLEEGSESELALDEAVYFGGDGSIRE